MSSRSYVRSVSGSRVQRRRRRRYRIINRKRFICSQLILCTLLVLLVTNIINANSNDIMGEELTVQIETTSEQPLKFLSSPLPERSDIEILKRSGVEEIEETPLINETEKNEEETDEVQTNEISSSQSDSSISKEERYLLEQLVEAEAKGESLMGKIAVANVVLNRVQSDEFPDTITEVIMQKRQFSPVANGSINNTPSEESVLAVKKALDEGYKVFGADVLYFCNTKIATNQWISENKEKVMTIGNHTFFK